MRLLALLAIALAACATPLAARGPLPDGWRQVRHDGDSRAYRHDDGGTIATDKSCAEADDVPLAALTNHLLFGIEHRDEHQRVSLVVADRAALRTRLDGTLDGVGVALDLVVLKKDGCVYDLMLVAPPAMLARRRPDFDRFILGFVAR